MASNMEEDAGDPYADLAREVSASEEPEQAAADDRGDLQAKPDKVRAELDAWRNAFARDGVVPEPSAVKQELETLRASEQTLQSTLKDMKLRENSLVMRLSLKERDIVELQAQIDDLRQSLTPKQQQLRAFLLDPAINAEFKRMKEEVKSSADKLKKSQEEVEGMKFDANSKTGRLLMAKCRALMDENEEIGKQIAEGKVATLEATIATQKKLIEELKTHWAEANEFVTSLDEEAEAYQKTIDTLQRQLHAANEKLKEVAQR